MAAPSRLSCIRCQTGFTLVELIIVVSIIALLSGILLPAVAGVQRAARKTSCTSNLRQLGVALQTYANDYAQIMPRARYMPDPFLSADTDPPLTEVIQPYFDDTEGLHCSGDQIVFSLCGTSYQYMTMVGGMRIADIEKRFRINASQIVLARDFDGATFDTTSGPIDVPPFHALRNLLFADGHAGNF